MKLLLKISFTISLLGIFLLLLLSNILEPPLRNINELSTKDIDKNVKVQGKITKIRNINEDFQILTISDQTGKIDITLNTNKQFKKDQNLIVTGRVSQYKNNLQIETDKITIR
ncbi:hypothetical protein CMI42_04880 [Candidatus Pacearchaeota archaeon]|nr:hypothetical protein [Candidatus Pacearchaeota archaeon]